MLRGVAASRKLDFILDSATNAWNDGKGGRDSINFSVEPIRLSIWGNLYLLDERKIDPMVKVFSSV